MELVLQTAPSIEPITLAEAKSYLRLDSNTFAESVTPTQSIVPGAHVIAAAYSLKGSGVSVIGKTALVILDSGTNLSGGTVDVKIQEADSDSDSLYTDWTGGAFTQVTTANDNAIQEKEYTGTKAFIRVVATVGTATCDFGVSVAVRSATHEDDTLLASLITAAREYVEDFTGRALINQTWNGYLDKFPAQFIELPKPELRSVGFVKYCATVLNGALTSNGTTVIVVDASIFAQGDTITVEAEDITLGATTDTLTFTSCTRGANSTTQATHADGRGVFFIWPATNYIVDINSWKGRIVLGYDSDWPTVVAYPSHPIQVRFTCGYGTAGSDLPERIRWALQLYLKTLYEFREEIITGTIVQSINAPYTVQAMLWPLRVEP